MVEGGVTFATPLVLAVIVMRAGSVVLLLVVGVVLVFRCLFVDRVGSPVRVASVVCVMSVICTVVHVACGVCVRRVQPRT